jgi:D-galactarolactone cycloisomerase
MQAISGIEIALWDLRGKATGKSVSELLGRRRDAVPIYASGMLFFHLGPDDYVKTFDRALAQGVGVLKIRVGNEKEWDRDWVQSMRRLIPESIDLIVDGKYNYTAQSAVEMSALLADLGVLAFEEPMLDTDLTAVGEAARRARVPFAYGEHAFTLQGFRDLVAHGAASILEPDVTICGGFAEAQRVARFAAESGCEVAAHCGGLSAIGLAANLHFVASLPEAMPLEYDNRPVQPLRDDILATGPIFDIGHVRNGCLAVPTGPGLGIEVDREALSRFPYEIDRSIASAPTRYAFPHI